MIRIRIRPIAVRTIYRRNVPTKADRALVRMNELATQSGTPIATLKHYLREGLIEPAVRKTKNSALYDVALIGRIKQIKELQRTKFLPLRVIKDMLDRGEELSLDATVAAAISRVLEREGLSETRTRDELLAAGLPAEQLAWLESTGLVTAKGGSFTGDDLALLRLLGTARRAGLTPSMLPFAVLAEYLGAIKNLVRIELEVFRKGVLPRAGADLDRLTEVAAGLSESLVVLLRRKLLLPTLVDAVKVERRKSVKKPRGKKR